MEDEFATNSPRTSPKRMSSHRYTRMSRKESPEEARHRVRGDIHLTRELIDFDVIKGYVVLVFSSLTNDHTDQQYDV